MGRRFGRLLARVAGERVESFNTYASELAKKIRRRQARIGVIGLGYVGLPLVHAFCRAGFNVFGFDQNKIRIDQIKRRKLGPEEANLIQVSSFIRQGKLSISTNERKLATCDCIIICVPTPLNKIRNPDLSFVRNALKSIQRNQRKGQLIVLESTVYPGTTDEILLRELSRNHNKVGRDFFLSFSPERIDPGNKAYPLRKIPKVVGGTTKKCTRLTVDLYRTIMNQVVPVSSPRTSEMTKLLENTFRIVNIRLINELLPIANRLGINLWEVIAAAKTKPFGFMPFYPGPGIGGHCIGIDPIYLSWKAKQEGLRLHFIEHANRINLSMPRYAVRRAVQILKKEFKRPDRSKVFVLGTSYKSNVGDVRESPALEIIEQLLKIGATVRYHDPFVPTLQLKDSIYRSIALLGSFLKKQDLVIIVTAHSNVNYALVLKHAKHILDTRNVFGKFKGSKANVIQL